MAPHSAKHPAAMPVSRSGSTSSVIPKQLWNACLPTQHVCRPTVRTVRGRAVAPMMRMGTGLALAASRDTRSIYATP